MGPDPESPRTPEDRVERLLAASRPIPDPRWVAATEERLFAAPARPARWPSLLSARRRPLFAGAAAAGALAATALTLSLTGVGPLAPGGERAVQAGDDCRFVAVKRQERVPMIVTDRAGRPSVEFRTRLVERRVKRCG